MSFTSVLKSIGSKFKLGVQKAIAIEAKLLPFEKAAATSFATIDPKDGVLVEDLVGILGNVEGVAQSVGASDGKGPQKLAAAVPQIEQAILQSPLFAGKQIPDLGSTTSRAPQPLFVAAIEAAYFSR